MPQKVYQLVDSVSLSSSYTAYTDVNDNQSTSTASTGQANYSFSYAGIGVPAGQVISSVKFRVESFGSPLHGTAIRGVNINGTDVDTSIPAATDIDIMPYVTGGDNTVKLMFKSGKSNTSYPSRPSSGSPNQRSNSGSLSFNDVKIIVDYYPANTPPGAPPWASVSPALHESGQVNITWGAAGDAENNIAGYRVQYATSSDGVNWTDWTTLGTYGGTSAADTPGIGRAAYEKYQVCSIDAYGAESGYTQTNAIRRNSLPYGPGSLRFSIGGGSYFYSGLQCLWNNGGDPDGNFSGVYIRLARYNHDAGAGAVGWAWLDADWVWIGNVASLTISRAQLAAKGAKAGDAIAFGLVSADALGAQNWDAAGMTASGYVYLAADPTAPSTFTASPEVQETGVALTWGGASGNGIAIAGYDIEYKTASTAAGVEGADGYAAAEGSPVSTAAASGSKGDSANIPRSYYERWRIRTRNAEGAVSAWKYSNTVRKNSAPTVPTSFTAGPALRESDTITLAWSGQTDLDGNIAYQEIQYAIRNTAGVWGGWLALKTSTGGSTTTTPTLADGERIKYQIRTVDALGVASGWKESNEVIQNTNPTAPTAFTATPALHEGGAVSLAWSGETDVDGNIAYQEIQYCIRSVAGVWGAWQALKTATGNSTTTTPTLADGERIKYMTRTVDAKGATSGWKESNEVIQNTNPTAATSFTASPTLYESGNVDIAWGGQTDPDANIAYQEIQYAIKAPGGIYGGWQALKTSTGSGTTTIPTLDRGAAIKFQARTVDALGAASGWKESNEVVRNSVPVMPAILFPGSGKTTYNTQPYVGLAISAEPNGQAQTLFFNVDGGVAQNAGAVTAGNKKLQVPAMVAGSHVIRFWLQDSQGAVSGEAAVTITVAANTYARSIAAGTLLWDEVNGHRTSTEILELKSRVNLVRAFYGLPAISLPYEGTTGVHTIKHVHTWMPNMLALYQGLVDTGAVSGVSVPDRVTRERNAPSAGVINQVRNMIGSL
jgi:hypothetical protein